MPKVGMPEIRKPQLVEATMAVINEVGLSGASVTLISKNAGVSSGIIHHYFGGKHGLLEETMRTVLRKLSAASIAHLQAVEPNDVMARVKAIVAANFDGYQVEGKVVKTWLAFWAQAMHDQDLHRLQRVNERRLLSHLRFELKHILPAEQAAFVAQGIAALIDGIWLRGALNPEGISADYAQKLVADYLEKQLAPYLG
ncbi:transcriptional regulator BetI [Agarivorans aestuarii]|uniref:transcriptional regulator BetI n=1 Tax=Agarivorans aestuarii TaxID=1563703 RepID=UPI001C812DCD|nr:transcriptional regulator BetI [Agarivorans aestuarii]